MEVSEHGPRRLTALPVGGLCSRTGNDCGLLSSLPARLTLSSMLGELPSDQALHPEPFGPEPEGQTACHRGPHLAANYTGRLLASAGTKAICTLFARQHDVSPLLP